MDDVRVIADGDEIRDIHVVSSSERRTGKMIARDIVSLLNAKFHVELDFRVVQVSLIVSRASQDAVPDEFAERSHDPARIISPEPARSVLAEPSRRRSERSAMPAPREHNGSGALPSASIERIRFASVNLTITGRRAAAEVELRWKGVTRKGTAEGYSTREGALRLVAQATLATLQEFLEEGVALGLDAVQMVHVGRNDIAVVALDLLVHRSQKTLVGCCTVEQDAEESVVLATLAALNRIVGGLPTREPTEYVLRPASR